VKHFIVILFVGLLCSGDALARYNGTGSDGLPWLLALPLGIINLIINIITTFWVPLLIFGVYIFIRYIYPEMKKK
jgi:hypothetical protein